jgi:ribosomal protein S14
VEWKLAGETEVLGENLPQRHFVHHKSHITRPGLESRTAAVGSQRLTAWAMAWPCNPYLVSIAWRGTVRGERWIRCDSKGSGRGLIRKYIGICVQVLSKAADNLRKNGWCPGWDANRAPLKYERYRYSNTLGADTVTENFHLNRHLFAHFVWLASALKHRQSIWLHHCPRDTIQTFSNSVKLFQIPN